MVIVPFLTYNGADSASINEREKDYKLCLERNLAHPQVQRVHILTVNSTDAVTRFKTFTSNSKLVISEVKSVDRARDPWDYISQNLVGRDVMFANADNYLGKGFDKIDPTIMDQQRIMYALSRHVAPEHNIMCNKTSSSIRELCSQYTGSHDVFLFRLYKPLPDEFFQRTEFDLVRFGMENRVIWLFENVLRYCVINPCSILETLHYHCSDLRTNIYKPRLEKGDHQSYIRPSQELYCDPK